jgi:hypothetical protein
MSSDNISEQLRLASLGNIDLKREICPKAYEKIKTINDKSLVEFSFNTFICSYYVDGVEFASKFLIDLLKNENDEVKNELISRKDRLMDLVKFSSAECKEAAKVLNDFRYYHPSELPELLKIENPSPYVKRMIEIFQTPLEPRVNVTTPEKFYVINLKERPERWENCKKLAEKYGLQVERMDAYKEEIGFVGCSKSHHHIVWEARRLGLPYVIAVEDDFDIEDDFNRRFFQLMDYALKRKGDWDVFSMGAQPRSIQSVVSDRLSIISTNDCNTTTFVVYNQSSYDKILDYDLIHVDKSMMRRIDRYHVKIFDKVFDPIDGQVRGKLTQWCPVPMIVYQAPGYSDTENVDRPENFKDLWFYKTSKSYEKYIDKTKCNWDGLWLNTRTNFEYTSQGDNMTFIQNMHDPLREVTDDESYTTCLWNCEPTPINPSFFERQNVRSKRNYKSFDGFAYFPRKSPEEFKNFHPVKTKILSSVTSGRRDCPGHILRFDFMKFISDKILIDLYGRGAEKFSSRSKGALDDKGVGLYPYKYTIAIENSSHENYWTEKLMDGILSECLTFYYGCTNIDDFIDPRAIIKIDITDHEKALNTIVKAIEDNEYSKRLPYIMQAKKDILEKHCLAVACPRVIKELTEKKETIGLRFNKDSLKAWDRLKTLTGFYFLNQRKHESDHDFVLRCLKTTKVGDDLVWINPEYIPEKFALGRSENHFMINNSYELENRFIKETWDDIYKSLPESTPTLIHKPVIKAVVSFMNKEAPKDCDWFHHYPVEEFFKPVDKFSGTSLPCIWTTNLQMITYEIDKWKTMGFEIEDGREKTYDFVRDCACCGKHKEGYEVGVKLIEKEDPFNFDMLVKLHNETVCCGWYVNKEEAISRYRNFMKRVNTEPGIENVVLNLHKDRTKYINGFIPQDARCDLFK